MKCETCHLENKSSLSHCEHCGAALQFRTGNIYSRKSSVVLVFIILIAAALIAYFVRSTIFTDARMEETIAANLEEKQEQLEQLEAELKDTREKLSALQDKKKEAAAKTDSPFPVDLKIGERIVTGWVNIIDRWGGQVSKFRAGLAGDGWLALPARACFGGSSWQFKADSGSEVEISAGLWIRGDSVGLWHAAGITGDFKGPELDSWNSREPVSWSSLESTNEHTSIMPGTGRSEGFFVSIPLPEYINESGIFLQDNRVVGWTFSQIPGKGYMWPGKPGSELEYRTWVSYFYNTTFANGREERFAMAFNMHEEAKDLERLSLFVEGFKLEPKLALEDTPNYLLPEEIIKKIRTLVTRVIRSGEREKVVEMLSSQVLRSIGDVNLLIDIAPVIADLYGFGPAVTEIEDSGKHIVLQKGKEVPALNLLHKYLYRNWLTSLVDDREIETGLQTYNSAKVFYPDDPNIHLLGVELVFLDGDWEEAERLLNMRNYPPEYQDRYEILAMRIAGMKGQEGKIVIRFPHGSRRITLTAAVNGTLTQNFLVDTGATVVTIPSSTVEELGLEIEQGKRKITTAGGILVVHEVVIDSIEIDGWVEYNVRALVLDMPDNPGLGLLGLNYLGRFEMDLKPDEGTLFLTPR